MREIKHKGKRDDNGEWVYGTLVYPNLIRNHAYGTLLETTNMSTEGRFACSVFRVDPATVGQYTGLKDENGVEIYEGDKVLDFEGEIFTVGFDDGAFTADYPYGDKWDYLIDAIMNAEVTGNIHEAAK